MDSNPIVVGVDGSETALAAVRWAAREAILRGARLKILCCVDYDMITLSDYPIPEDYIHLLRERATKDLAEASAQALAVVVGAGSDIGIETKMLLCEPRAGLQTLSESAQLLVLGAHGATRRVSGLLGSVADALSTRASCPIAVVREQPEAILDARPNTVVVGIDGSPCSRQAVEVAYEEASIRNAKLIAIHAWHLRKVHSVFKTDHTKLAWEEARTAEEAVLAETLAGHREQYPDLEVSQQILNCDPVAALRDAAGNAGLLVVGSRGRRGFTAGLLGSTSRALLHSATCPVLIARP
ncbi:universal stress protein [Nocardia sp. 348MFTsu5.1]|uniref:universal stress protein n=1 Tax=Nocardia sp. 348MFTsu5.1 TaxID=1172185 RepID=UPI0003813402|nr:universal stress protein [Nocardia sp. 348MFTsu5.1]